MSSETRTRSRPSSSARGYGAKDDWPRIRAEHLQMEPNCRVCADDGKTTAAVEVDHQTPIARGGTYDHDNLVSMCRPHHSAKTASQDGGFGNPTLPERQLDEYLDARGRNALMTEPAVANVEIVQVAIDLLHPDPANPRRISEHQMEALTRSLRENGFVVPMLVRRENNMIIGGHQRLVAARRLGYQTVPVIYLDVTQEKARVLNLSLNKISGDWDQELLARLLADLGKVPDVDLTLTGFGEDEVQNLLKSLGARDRRERLEQFDLDAALDAARAAPRAQHGEMWALGDHRLLCGDACDAAALSRLLGGEKAAMAFTDPPYNVSLGDHGGQGRGQRRRRLQNDALPQEEWERFVRGWARNLLSSVDGAIYVCMSSKEWPLVSRVLEEEGGHWSDTLIWSKDRFVLGRADYQRQYEPIWYGWREGSAHYWCGDRDQGDVLSVKRPSSSEAHPTQKPLELMERAIENSSRAGDVVLDLFLGSGSTLIAAERTGRVCYGVELDPHYASVVLARWEAFTGQTAVTL